MRGIILTISGDTGLLVGDTWEGGLKSEFVAARRSGMEMLSFWSSGIKIQLPSGAHRADRHITSLAAANTRDSTKRGARHWSQNRH